MQNVNILAGFELSLDWYCLFSIPVGYGYLTVYVFLIPFRSTYNARTFIP